MPENHITSTSINQATTNAVDRPAPQVIRVPTLTREREQRRLNRKMGLSVPEKHGEFVRVAWDRWRSRPLDKLDAREVCRTLDDHEIGDGLSARILVFGDLGVPDPHDRMLEPVVVTPTRLFWARRGRVLSVGLMAIMVMQAVIHAIFDWSLATLFISLLFFAILFGVVIVFRKLWLRNEYMRFAPGIIQFLRFPPLGKGAPNIRTFTITPGTTVIIKGPILWRKGKPIRHPLKARWYDDLDASRSRASLTMTILQDGKQEVVPIGLLPNAREIVPKLFDCLVSTAKIPELSDTELTC